MRPLRVLAATLALSALGAAPASGPVPYRWQNVVVGAGGFAPGIVFSPAAPGIAYLRTDMGGAYRWEDSAGRWVPLMDGFGESSFYGVESIAADPLKPNRVYAAVGMHARGASAILRSDDRGTNWATFPVPFKMGGNEDGRGLGERLAIDPHRSDTLFFGSRHDGLWRSDDAGAHWARVAAFPYAGARLPAPRTTHGGVGFVLFDPRPGSTRLFASVADKGVQGLYQSADSGRIWTRVAGGPAELLPIKAALDGAGTLYVTYADAIGPNGVLRGAVWALDAEGFRDVTPQKGPDAPEGGYIGVTADPHRSGMVYVSTFNRWQPGDTIWRSLDGGAHWRDLGPASRRDTRISPFLKWGRAEAEFGHWIAGLALDPFAPTRLAYTTGATVYVTRDAPRARLNWSPWVKGIEQTAIITLTSPTGGAHLVTGFGDLGGFVHNDLAKSPPGMHLNPRNTNTNTLDYAGATPRVLVRSGNVHAEQHLEGGLGWSQDGGQHWRPLRTPHWRGDGSSLEENGRAPISVSADGTRFYVAAERPLLSRDQGAHWIEISGLPANARVTADKLDPRRAWAIDYSANRLMRSIDGGLHFKAAPAHGVCDNLGASRPRNRESQAALLASPFAAGDLFLRCAGALYRSRDGGDRFARISADLDIALFGLGRGRVQGQPAIYAVAARDGVTAIWRNIDGARWQRINDDAHRWGNRLRVISGDPRLYGRVYIGTDGRGVIYGDERP